MWVFLRKVFFLLFCLFFLHECVTLHKELNRKQKIVSNFLFVFCNFSIRSEWIENY